MGGQGFGDPFRGLQNFRVLFGRGLSLGFRVRV